MTEEKDPVGLGGELGFERLNHAMCELRAAIGYLGVSHCQVCIGVLGDGNAQRVRDVLPEAITTGPGSQLCELQGIQIHQFKSRTRKLEEAAGGNAETSAEVASIAGELLGLDAADIDALDSRTEGSMGTTELLEKIHKVAASCLGQRQ